MNTRPTPPEPDSDTQLEQRLRVALTRSPDESLAPMAPLEARAMAQWQQPTAAVQPVPMAALQAGWHGHPLVWSGTMMVVVLAALQWGKPWVPTEPGVDELMQPDVRSQITVGEL